MTAKNRILLFVLLGLSLVHLSLTLIFSLDFFKIPSQLRLPAYHYSVPFFYQSWSMFAPSVPKYHQELQFRSYEGGTWTRWQDATAPYQAEVHSAMEYVEQNISSGLSQQVAGNYYQKDGEIQWEAITSSLEYQKAIYYVQKMYLHHQQTAPDSLQLRMMYRFILPPKDTSGIQTHFLEFPPLHIKQR